MATNTCKARSAQRPLGGPSHVPVDGPRQTWTGLPDTSATAANHHLLLCIVERVLVTATHVTGASPAEQEASG